jgi:hypothetical protein
MDILIVWLLAVALVSLSVPRVTPPGGLTGIDFVLIASLPVGAFFAGRRHYSGVAFLVYGGLGTLVFVPGFLANSRLGLGYLYGQSSPATDVILWAVGTLCMAVFCRLAGRAGQQTAADVGQPARDDETNAATGANDSKTPWQARPGTAVLLACSIPVLLGLICFGPSWTEVLILAVPAVVVVLLAVVVSIVMQSRNDPPEDVNELSSHRE